METTDYKVIIPEESYELVEFREDDLPGVMVINQALKNFESKIVFSWHLSVVLTCENLIENGMPSRQEREILDPYGDLLDSVFKGSDLDKPNALFLARITWNETRELIYRVFDPEPINEYLQKTITEKAYTRPFDYRIDPDSDWELATWHLNILSQ